MSNPLFCNKCGAQAISSNARFCTACGARLYKHRSPVREFFAALLKCLAYYGVFIGISYGIEIVYTVYVMVKAAGEKGVPLKSLSEEAILEEYSRFAPQVFIISAALVLLCYFIIFKVRKKKMAKEIQLGSMRLTSALGVTAMGFSAQFVIALLLSLLYAFYPELMEYSNSETIETIYKNSDPVFQLIQLAVATPLLEEVLFRGLIHTRLIRIMPAAPAVILSSLIFGVAHGNPEQFVYTFILGALMAVVFEKYNSLWASVLIHAAFNGTSCLLQYVQFENDSAYLALFAGAIGVFIISAAFIFCTKEIEITKNPEKRNGQYNEAL